MKIPKPVVSAAVFVALPLAFYAFFEWEGNPFLAPFRSEITESRTRVTVGPMPLESDLRILKANGVRTVVSLLDTKVPDEKKLFDTETLYCQSVGLKLVSEPLESLALQRLPADYPQRVQAAADRIEKLPGKLYVHGNAGIYRVKAVSDALHAKGVTVGTYLIRSEDRGVDKRTVDRAREELQAGNYAGVVELLGPRSEAEPEAKILEAWARYRMNDLATACPIFHDAYEKIPQNVDARLGTGYCAYRNGDFVTAEGRFKDVLAVTPKDASALAGMGFVRCAQGRQAECANLLEASLKVDSRNTEARELLQKLAPGRAARSLSAEPPSEESAPR